MQGIRITILGTRGSVSVEGPEYSFYGGATACICVEINDKVVVFDGGSGILALPELLDDKKEFNLLLTHSHIDHIAGITCCPCFYNKDYKINIYSTSFDSKKIKEKIDTLMSPPLWPVTTDSFLADVKYFDCNKKFNIDNITISCEKATHPGGATIFRVDCAGKSVVYATDNELNSNNFEMLKQFAQNCDLLLCDGQYSKDELTLKKGFGHSCWEDAARVGAECNAKSIGIIHHDPLRTDKQLDLMQNKLQNIYPNAFFAHFKQEIIL